MVRFYTRLHATPRCGNALVTNLMIGGHASLNNTLAISLVVSPHNFHGWIRCAYYGCVPKIGMRVVFNLHRNFSPSVKHETVNIYRHKSFSKKLVAPRSVTHSFIRYISGWRRHIFSLLFSFHIFKTCIKWRLVFMYNIKGIRMNSA